MIRTQVGRTRIGGIHNGKGRPASYRCVRYTSRLIEDQRLRLEAFHTTFRLLPILHTLLCAKSAVAMAVCSSRASSDRTIRFDLSKLSRDRVFAAPSCL